MIRKYEVRYELHDTMQSINIYAKNIREAYKIVAQLIEVKYIDVWNYVRTGIIEIIQLMKPHNKKEYIEQYMKQNNILKGFLK